RLLRLTSLLGFAGKLGDEALVYFRWAPVRGPERLAFRRVDCDRVAARKRLLECLIELFVEFGLGFWIAHAIGSARSRLAFCNAQNVVLFPWLGRILAVGTPATGRLIDGRHPTATFGRCRAAQQ